MLIYKSYSLGPSKGGYMKSNLKGTSLKLWTICLWACILIFTFQIPLLATLPPEANRYVLDQGNWLEPASETEMEIRLKEIYDLHSLEAVVVTKALDQMPSFEALQAEAEKLVEEGGYGQSEYWDEGGIFLFINKREGLEPEFAVFPLGDHVLNYTNFQIDHITTSIRASYNISRTEESMIDAFIELAPIYLYPVINELGDNRISFATIEKATEAIYEWRNQYNQNIVLLLNAGFAEGLYQKYLEEYFISQGYGSGEEESGVFLIFDDTTSRFDIRFYGTCSKQYSEEETGRLVSQVSQKLESLDIVGIVQAIQDLLKTQVNNDHKVSLLENLIDEHGILSDPWQTIIWNKNQNYRELFGGVMTTVILQTEKGSSEADLEQMAEEILAQDELAAQDAIITILDLTSQELVSYTSGEMTDFYYDKGFDVNMDQVLDYLKNQLVEDGFSQENISRFQVSLVDFFIFLRANGDDLTYMINPPAGLDFSAENVQMDYFQEEGILPFVLFTNTWEADPNFDHRDTKKWALQFQKVMEASELLDQGIIAIGLTSEPVVDVIYIGHNPDVAKLIPEIDQEIKDRVEKSGYGSLARDFQELVKTSIVLKFGDQDSEGTIPDIEDLAPDLDQALDGSVSKVNSFLRNIFLIIIGVFVVILLGILIIALVISRKKKRQIPPAGPNQQPGTYYHPNYGPGPNQMYGQANGPNPGPMGPPNMPGPNSAYHYPDHRSNLNANPHGSQGPVNQPYMAPEPAYGQGPNPYLHSQGDYPTNYNAYPPRGQNTNQEDGYGQPGNGGSHNYGGYSYQRGDHYPGYDPAYGLPSQVTNDQVNHWYPDSEASVDGQGLAPASPSSFDMDQDKSVQEYQDRVANMAASMESHQYSETGQETIGDKPAFDQVQAGQAYEPTSTSGASNHQAWSHGIVDSSEEGALPARDVELKQELEAGQTNREE